jgi:hypothetical protein
LLKKELWNKNLAKKRNTTQQIELPQAPIMDALTEWMGKLICPCW